MPYINSKDFSHRSPKKVGVLLCNLGSPDAAETGAVRRYLKQFLSDPRVVEFPRFLWFLVLNLVILRIRPARSARSYRGVWTEQGSPLIVHSREQHRLLEQALNAKYGDAVVIEWAMRYGNPAIDKALQSLFDQGVHKLLVLPLYPQYSATTTASTFDALAHDFTQRRLLPDLRFVSSYHDFPAYIEALAESVESHWQQHGRAEKIIFSFHGIPMRYLHNGDPYHCQCHKTARLLAERLNLNKTEYMTTFQSRFGREPWLQPYMDETLKQLAADGLKSVQVLCPGFAADCLETIEEIDVENRNYFLEAGGERFEYIPALNENKAHIDALNELITNNIQDWLTDIEKDDPEQRQALYSAHTDNRLQ